MMVALLFLGQKLMAAEKNKELGFQLQMMRIVLSRAKSKLFSTSSLQHSQTPSFLPDTPFIWMHINRNIYF